MFFRKTHPRALRIILAAAGAVFLIIAIDATAAERVRIGYTSPGPQHGLLWLGDTAAFSKKQSRCGDHLHAR